jgi:hypothetical protein
MLDGNLIQSIQLVKIKNKNDEIGVTEESISTATPYSMEIIVYTPPTS